MKKALLVLLLLVLAFAFAACRDNEPEVAQTTTAPATTTVPGATTPAATEPAPVVHEGAPRIVTVGTWNQPAFDPLWRDPITGDIGTDPHRQWASEVAWNTVLDELNVHLEFRQYPADLRQVLLTSVLAGDPFADIVGLWGGSQGAILGQNILRPLDQFADIFADDESSWMFMDPIFGHNYLIKREIAHLLTWPMVFNISLLEQVDGLRDENGVTVFPTCLYMRGEWTWSRFEEYLEIVEAHFRGVPAPVRPEYTITPFQTDYRFTTRKAMQSAGVAVFGPRGLEISTPEAIAAVEFLNRLLQRDLMNVVFNAGSYIVPGWTWTANDFGRGEMVFAEIPQWLQSSAGTQLAERGESMGIIPFPRADFMEHGDPRVQMERNPGDSFAVLRGTSDEQAALALDAFRLWTVDFWRHNGGVENALDFLEATAEVQAITLGYDIFHPIVGADVLAIFTNYAPQSPNEFVDIVGISDAVLQDIVGQSLFGSAPEFAVNVAQREHIVLEMLERIGGALEQDEFINNQPPIFTSQPIVMPLYTDLDTFDFSEFIFATGIIDGIIDVRAAAVDLLWDYAAIPTDVTTPGAYGPQGIRLRVQDTCGNITGWHNQQVWVFDPANTEPPTFELQEEFPTIALDTNAADINWNQFIYSALDAGGIDLRGRMVPDLGQLDVTMPGTHPVVITVEDFAGNVAYIEIEVTVE